MIKILVNAGADVNRRVAEGRTPIYHAIYSTSVETVKLMIELGAKLDVEDSGGYTPLRYAATRLQTKMFDVLRTGRDET